MSTRGQPEANRDRRPASRQKEEKMEILTLNGRPPRILVAEDETEMRSLLNETLRLSGCEVVECRDGLELMERLVGFQGSHKALEYDLIISDIRMPYTTGMDVLRGMREYAGDPPVILVTGFGDEHTSDTARQLGAAAVLSKPFDLSELMALVRRCLRKDSRPGYRRESRASDPQWTAF
jgi:DNA-binding response OmpR family regulator